MSRGSWYEVIACLIDAGMFSAFPGGLRLKGSRCCAAGCCSLEGHAAN
jgi:hypothetical protein